MNKTGKIYLVWNDEDEEAENHYWEQYYSLEDAVGEHPNKDIFEATPKNLGKFKIQTSVVALLTPAKGKKKVGKK